MIVSAAVRQAAISRKEHHTIGTDRFVPPELESGLAFVRLAEPCGGVETVQCGARRVVLGAAGSPEFFFGHRTSLALATLSREQGRPPPTFYQPVFIKDKRMNMQKTFLVAAVTAVVCAGFTAPLQGQTRTRNFPGFTKNYGSNLLGGRIHMTGSMRTVRSGADHRATAKLDMGGHAKLLGRSFQVARLLANVTERKGSSPSSKGKIDVYLGNSKIWSRNVATSATYTLPARYLPLAGGRMTWYLGPIPVTIRASAGVGCSFSLFYGLFPSTGGVGARGCASAYAQAVIGAQIGYRYAGGGVDFIGELAKQTLSLDGWASVTNGIRGRVTYTVTAIVLKIRIWATLLWKTWRKTIYQRSYGRFSRTVEL